MKSVLVFLVYSFGVAILTASFFTFDYFKRHDLVLPRTALADMDLTGMSRSQVRAAWSSHLAKFENLPVQIAAEGQVKQITAKELGVDLNETELTEKIPFAGSISNFGIIFWTIAGQRIRPTISIDRSNVLRAIENKFPTIPKMRNARFVLRGNELETTPAQTGLSLDVDPLIEQIKGNISFFDPMPLFAEFKQAQPTVSQSDLERYKEQIQAAFPEKIFFFHEKQKWEIDFKKHPDWIMFQSPFVMAFDPVAFSNFLNEKVVKSLEQTASGMTIWRGQDSKIHFEGEDREGREIDREALLALTNEAITAKISEVAIPVLTIKPKLQISDDLQIMGVHESIGVGYTRFVGSPPNRTYNIGIGISKFDGLLIAPGETFSFNKNLGVVDGSTGYKKELVIKPEGTVPEFGGGICQVSSTMYRAIIYSGLPVVARTPHKYAVSYYAQVGGHGLDATVYSPSPDLKFINDTPGYILIHSYVDGPSAYFKFYGTSDGRSIAMDGPYISNRRSAPSEPILVPDAKLKPGEKKQIEKPHNGFDTVWYRYITKNGETKKETITSRYQAIPAKFSVGGMATGTSSASNAASSNPYE